LEVAQDIDTPFGLPWLLPWSWQQSSSWVRVPSHCSPTLKMMRNPRSLKNRRLNMSG